MNKVTLQPSGKVLATSYCRVGEKQKEKSPPSNTRWKPSTYKAERELGSREVGKSRHGHLASLQGLYWWADPAPRSSFAFTVPSLLLIMPPSLSKSLGLGNVMYTHTVFTLRILTAFKLTCKELFIDV